MTKKLWLFIILFFIVLGHAVLLAIEWTRPMVFDAYTALGIAIGSGIAAAGASEWWLLYGNYISAGTFLIIGVGLTAMYYRGKIKVWRWGAQKAVETAYGTKQPAPAPTPTPLATPQVAPVVPEVKEEAKTA